MKYPPDPPEECRYCGGNVSLEEWKYGPVYFCNECGARVGCHKDTSSPPKPLGTLANAELRRWRSALHAAFDPLWMNGDLSRSEAYIEHIQEVLNIPTDRAHIGMLEIGECKNVLWWLMKHGPKTT